MPKELLRRYLPSAAMVRRNRALRPVRHWLARPELWHLNRRSVAGAAFVGLFCAFLPIPLQMLVAAALAIAFHVNLPISVALVWITNPLTIAPIFYFCYRLGAWLLGRTEALQTFQLDLDWLIENLSQLAYPLVFGSLVCGWVAGVTGFILVRVAWRAHVLRRWQERRERRRLKKAAARLAAQLEADTDLAQ